MRKAPYGKWVHPVCDTLDLGQKNAPGAECGECCGSAGLILACAHGAGREHARTHPYLATPAHICVLF